MNYPYIQQRQLLYRPVTAYTADRPILVNGHNINTGLYPVLNYKPVNAEYPFIYVPIAEFSRVGATVLWDEANQLLIVESDYYQLKAQYSTLQSDYDELLRFYILSVNAFSRNISYFEREIARLTEENENLKSQLS